MEVFETFKKRDIIAGEFTLFQRMEMEKILRSGVSGIEMYYGTIECLHGFRPTTKQAFTLFDYLQDIINGFMFWIEKEKLIRHAFDIELFAKSNHVKVSEVLTWSYRKWYEINLME